MMEESADEEQRRNAMLKTYHACKVSRENREEGGENDR